MRYSFITLLCICFSCGPKHDLPITIELSQNWEFRKVRDSIWHSATVPGNVFTDLLDHKLIEDPFIGTNEERVQWVSEANWEYQTYFSLSEEMIQKKQLEFNFEGLDTYASVFLNDSLILKANNAFRRWRLASVEFKTLLKKKINFELSSKHRLNMKTKPKQNKTTSFRKVTEFLAEKHSFNMVGTGHPH